MLVEVCKNPKSPGFNHYLFESVAALIKHGAAADKAQLATYEATLFPAFDIVLSNDVQVRGARGWHAHCVVGRGVCCQEMLASCGCLLCVHAQGLQCHADQYSKGSAVAAGTCTNTDFWQFRVHNMWLVCAAAVAPCLQEFHPYVFQILAQLIELSSPPLNAVSAQQHSWAALACTDQQKSVVCLLAQAQRNQQHVPR
jgi:hypothetical protein